MRHIPTPFSPAGSGVVTERESSSMPSRRRELVAELILLELYDSLRAYAGHDYGSGQRQAELSRRRRQLNARELDLTELDVSDAALVAAWDRVCAPRFSRARAETYRHNTPSTSRTLHAWARLGDYIERKRDNLRSGDWWS